jgi:nucleotide-binding universal stress UspA family protein
MDVVLVATNGSPASRKAAELGVELAAATRADVIFLRVAEGLSEAPLRLDAEGDQALAEAAGLARKRGVWHGSLLVTGEVADSISAHAEALQADVLVVGESRRRPLPFASVPRRLVANAPCPVLVAPRKGGPNPPLRQLCAFVDDSPASQRAVEIALDVAGGAGARVLFLSVVEMQDSRVSMNSDGPMGYNRSHSLTPAFQDVALNRALARAEERDVDAEGRVIASSDAEDEIVTFAGRRRADLLLVGLDGRGLRRRRLVQRLLRRAHSPVVAVPAPAGKPVREAAPRATRSVPLGFEKSLRARRATLTRA